MENKIYVEMTFEELKAYNDFKDGKNELSVEELISKIFSKIEDVKFETGINPNTMQNYYEQAGTIDTENGHLYICYYCYKRRKNNEKEC